MSHNYILTKDAAQEKMHRMALEIAEYLIDDSTPLLLIGIKENGIFIAEKIKTLLTQYLQNDIQVIWAKLDKKNPSDVELSTNVDFNNKHVIVIDDVINSGRSLLYTLKPLLNSHPKSIQTLILVERMHAQFPIKPNYVGMSIATTLHDHIQVEVINGEVEGAFLN